MFGRRARGLIAHGHSTLNSAEEKMDYLIKLVEELVADYQDGVRVGVTVDSEAIGKLIHIMQGNPGELPVSLTIDPTWDAGDDYVEI